ncbi:MAG: tetratricopeptide repeat protein [Bacteriovoracaceae bacterium]
MSEATQTQTLEQTLNKTDLGHLIYEYRNIFFGTIVAILVGVTGYVLWNQSRQSKALENSLKVYEFESKTWVDAKAGKVAPADLIKAFEGLDQNIQTAPSMLPLVLDMSKFLYEKGSVNESEALLKKIAPSVKHAVASFFLSMQLSAILEKNGKVDEAISVLEKQAAVKDGLLASKVSLELGRLYLSKGDKGKAQTQFDFILSTYPNDAEAKLAKLYLSQLAAK